MKDPVPATERNLSFYLLDDKIKIYWAECSDSIIQKHTTC